MKTDTDKQLVLQEEADLMVERFFTDYPEYERSTYKWIELERQKQLDLIKEGAD